MALCAPRCSIIKLTRGPSPPTPPTPCRSSPSGSIRAGSARLRWGSSHPTSGHTTRWRRCQTGNSSRTSFLRPGMPWSTQSTSRRNMWVQKACSTENFSITFHSARIKVSRLLPWRWATLVATFSRPSLVLFCPNGISCYSCYAAANGHAESVPDSHAPTFG